MTSPPPQSGAPSNVVYSGKIVRRAGIADIEAVVELANVELANDVPTIARWSRADYSRYCVAEDGRGNTQEKALFVALATRESMTALVDEGLGDESSSGKIVGFAAFSALPYAGAGECELANMAVAESFRRQGVAQRLLEAGLLWCRAWYHQDRLETPGACMAPGLRLEVRASNANAIAFYRQMGFEQVGRRPGYYEQPTEDAILMQKM